MSHPTTKRPAASRPNGRAVLTPPQLAERWGVSPEKVIAFIKRGELVAFNLALRRRGRARWRIPFAEVEAFERGRQANGRTPKAPRRREVAKDFVAYY